jgi:lipopolysaccharide/colanic/teichoic acid biosynthesis glycosyltransferase
MVADAEKIGPAISGHSDPRVTRVGRVLRATKIDELPQILNVIRGEMTLVGPRAEVERYIRYYTPEERLLLQVRPGLTGPGQVFFTTDQAGELDRTGDPEELYVKRQIHAKLALDLEYLRRRGLRADMSVLLRTLALLCGWK